MHIIRIEHTLNCGKTTCYNENPHDRCQFLLTRKFGQEWCCGLFNENTYEYGIVPKTICDYDGLLQRLPECINAETGETPNV